jgi:hypothetical protein
MSETNGRHKRPRTPSHPPQDATTPDGPDGSTPTPADATTGRTDLSGEAAVSAVSAVTNNGHAPDGKFAAGNGVGHRFEKGNRFGKGNPLARRQHEHRMQFLDAVHPETIPALARKLQHDALKGDEFAVRVLLDYCLAKPAQAVELSGPEGEPLERSAELSAALGAALSPFSEEVRFAVLGVIRKAVHAGRAE